MADCDSCELIHPDCRENSETCKRYRVRSCPSCLLFSVTLDLSLRRPFLDGIWRYWCKQKDRTISIDNEHLYLMIATHGCPFHKWERKQSYLDLIESVRRDV